MTHHSLRKVPEAYNLYRNRSIKPSDPEAEKFRKENGDRLNITLLGCFDTVGSLGMPDMIPFIPLNHWINEKHKFCDTDISIIVQNALHAVAIDEIRKVFDVTPMTRANDAPGQILKEVWFPGDHGCVGGGLPAHGLSDTSLQWIVDEIAAMGLGLEIDLEILPDDVELNPLEYFDNVLQGIYKLTVQIERFLPKDAMLHPSVQEQWEGRADYRPRKIEGLLKNMFIYH